MKEIFQTRQCLTTEEIKGYLNESLVEEDLHSIEQHIIDCELCNTTIEGWSKIDQPESILAELEQTELIKQGENTPIRLPQKQKIFKGAKVYIAAAASIAVILALTFLLNRQTASPLALYGDYYEYAEMPNPATRNSEITEIKDLTRNAYRAYSIKDFPRSSAIFDQILEVESKNPTALFFGGLAHLESGQYDTAIRTLDKLASQPDTQLAEDATWYLALALLRNNDIERCREVLISITTKGGFYSDKAGKLHKKLEGL